MYCRVASKKVTLDIENPSVFDEFQLHLYKDPQTVILRAPNFCSLSKHSGG